MTYSPCAECSRYAASYHGTLAYCKVHLAEARRESPDAHRCTECGADAEQVLAHLGILVPLLDDGRGPAPVVLDGQGGGPLGVQVCAGASHAARRTKALAEPRLREWLQAPARFEVWSYSKTGERGKRKLWTLRTEALAARDVPAAGAKGAAS